MQDHCDREFASIVNTLHSLGKAYVRLRTQGSDTSSIERAIKQLVSAMDEDQRQAYRLYQKELRRGAQKRIAIYQEVLDALERLEHRQKNGS